MTELSLIKKNMLQLKSGKKEVFVVGDKWARQHTHDFARACLVKD
jgi:hypothetical protein